MDKGHRFRCLWPGCKPGKDFSMVTLFEHLAFHLKDMGFVEHFEYKCDDCHGCYFTSRIFMVHHKMAFPLHRISMMKELDLDNIAANSKLTNAVTKMTTDLLRNQFEPIGIGESGRRRRSRSESYRPHTPGTPRRSRSRASSRGSCVSSRAGSPFDRHEQMELQRHKMDTMLRSLALPQLDDKWKELLVKCMFQSNPELQNNNAFGGGFNSGILHDGFTGFQQRDQGRGSMMNERGRPGSPSGNFGSLRGNSSTGDLSPKGRFGDSSRGEFLGHDSAGYRGGRGVSHDGGRGGFCGRSAFNGERGRGGFRGRGDFTGERGRGRFRGRGDGSFRGRGDGSFRGRGGDRGSFRGGFGGRSPARRSGSNSPKRTSPVTTSRARSFSRSRSNSPQRMDPAPKRGRSFSRSQSRSKSPPMKDNRKRMSPMPNDDVEAKKARDDRRSFSRSPKRSP